MNPFQIPRSVGRLLAGLIVALCALIGLGSTATAGGWAVTTLDSTLVPVAGEPLEVGFMIRQHGVTPVSLDGGVALEVVAADGTTLVFPATQNGGVGHYVATVLLAEPGEYTWTVHQGWFAPQKLGSVTVSGQSSAANADHRLPGGLRFGLPVIAAMFGAAALAAAFVGRRRHTAAA